MNPAFTYSSTSSNLFADSDSGGDVLPPPPPHDLPVAVTPSFLPAAGDSDDNLPLSPPCPADEVADPLPFPSPPVVTTHVRIKRRPVPAKATPIVPQ